MYNDVAYRICSIGRHSRIVVPSVTVLEEIVASRMLAMFPPTLNHLYLHAAACMRNNIVGVAWGRGLSK